MSQTLHLSPDTVEQGEEDTEEDGRDELADMEPAVAAIDFVLLQCPAWTLLLIRHLSLQTSLESEASSESRNSRAISSFIAVLTS